jgi:hypothetical protein
MSGREEGGSQGDHARHVRIGVVAPQDEFDPPSLTLWCEPVVPSGRLDRCDPDGEVIQLEFDMIRRSRFWNAKGLPKADCLVERLGLGDVSRLEIDHGRSESGCHRS